jgi:hypothetical protein
MPFFSNPTSRYQPFAFGDPQHSPFEVDIAVPQITPLAHPQHGLQEYLEHRVVA